jgi:hypothetical protein
MTKFIPREDVIPAFWLNYIYNADPCGLAEGEADYIDSIIGHRLMDVVSEDYFSWTCDYWFEPGVQGGMVVDVIIYDTLEEGEKKLQESTL